MSTEILLTFAVLGVTILLFVKEWLRVDVVALCVMLALPWLGLVEPHEALAGLSSNAVFSIIGVMILGCGVDRSGIMAKVTRPILRIAGSSERRLVSLVSAAVGGISAFRQNIGAARDSRFRGTQGTAIIGLFGATAAWTGVSEKTLERLGDEDFKKIYLYPNSHAGYYPGASPIAMKVLFRKSDGRLLGAQALGYDGVDKRISALAMALQMGATIYDLEEAELCYAPQFGSAKDPVNFAGMVDNNDTGYIFTT